MSSTTLEPRTAAPRAAARSRKKRRPPLLPWGLLLPSLVVLGILVGYPLVRLFIMSFQE